MSDPSPQGTKEPDKSVPADRVDSDVSGVRAPVFFITPIGPPNSISRRRADGISEGVLEEPLKTRGLELQRADKIEKPGLITVQIVQHIHDAPFVVADLANLNPNVLYELGLADAFGKPVIRFVDNVESLPFDVSNDRVIELSDSDGSVEVVEARRAKNTFSSYVDEILKDGEPSSVVTAARVRASWDALGQGSDSQPRVELMLQAVLDKVDGLDALRSRPSQVVAPNSDDALAAHIARRFNQKLSKTVDVFSTQEGYAVDLNGAIDAERAEEMRLIFSDAGLGSVAIISGVIPRPPTIPDYDEEPF